MSEQADETQAEPETEEDVEDVPPAEDEPEEDVPFEEPLTAPEQAAKDEAAAMALDRKLTSEDKRHQTALGKAFGEEWPQHVRCALCDGIGFLDPNLAGGLTHDQWGQVLETAIAMTVVPYIEDTNYETCPHCDGRGKTLSGAKPPLDPTKLCDVCSGNGFIQKAPRVPQYVAPVTTAPTNGQIEYTIPSYGSSAADDQWGRPAGHAHYGIPPAAVVG